MSVIELRFYSGDDPNGALLGTLTDAECSAISLRVALRGLGAGRFSISQSRPEATAALINKGNYVRVVIPSIQAEPVWAFWLWEGAFNLLDAQGDDTLTFGGPGPLGILRDAILHYEPWAPGQPRRGSSDVDNVWWWNNEPYGAILTRVIEEGQYEPGEPLAPVTLDFDRVNDSDSIAWPTITAEYQQPIQANVLKVFEDLRDAGDMIVVSDPDLLVSAYQTYGTDRSSASFAAGKVRLTDTNILTGLGRRIHATNELTHVLGRDKDSVYFAEIHPDYGSGRARWGAIDVPETNDAALLSRIGQQTLVSSTLNTDAFEAEVTPGDDESIGRYLPWLHYDIGDTITVDAGTGPYAYADADAQIVAFRVDLDEAADDTSDDSAHRSLHTVIELNAVTSEGSPSEGRAVAAPGCHCLELCAAGRCWTLPLEFLIKQRWDVGAGDSAHRDFAVRHRNGVTAPWLNVNWDYDYEADATDAITLYVRGQDQDVNDTGYNTALHVLAPANGIDFLTRFRIEADAVMARCWAVGDAEPGAWQVTATGGGFALTGLGVSSLNRLEDFFTSQFPNPTTFWQDTLTIVSGFGLSAVSDTFTTAVGSGNWGNSEINGALWEVESSPNAGVTGGEAFWTAANLAEQVASQLIIPCDELGDCPAPIGPLCFAGISGDAARCDHVHAADAADLSYSGAASGATVAAALDSIAAAGGSYVAIAKWGSD